MLEMPSVTVRLILFALLVAVYFVHRSGYFKKRKERLAKDQKAAEDKQRQQEKRERLRKARDLKEREEQKTAEILKIAAPGMTARTTQAAGLDVYFLEGGAKNDNPSIVLLHGLRDWRMPPKRSVRASYRRAFR